MKLSDGPSSPAAPSGPPDWLRRLSGAVLHVRSRGALVPTDSERSSARTDHICCVPVHVRGCVPSAVCVCTC